MEFKNTHKTKLFTVEFLSCELPFGGRWVKYSNV